MQIDTILAFGLWLNENVPFKIIGLCLTCNILYFLLIRNFLIVDLSSRVLWRKLF